MADPSFAHPAFYQLEGEDTKVASHRAQERSTNHAACAMMRQRCNATKVRSWTSGGVAR
jgi:hypothetical protein